MKKQERKISPVISTGDLQKLSRNQDIIVIDIRQAVEYSSGHIPGAVNIPFSSWAVMRDKLDLELPDEEALERLMNRAGIDSESFVVIAGKADHTYELANACRVADTLIYAGIRNVTILDGGYDKWIKERRSISTERIKPGKKNYKIHAGSGVFVSLDYVRKQIGKAVIIDTRDPDVYFGVIRESYAPEYGHIPGAKCLPAPWIWTSKGLFRTKDELNEMAENIAGKSRNREIIIYCGVGGYTAAWWFVLTQILDYKNVKFFDGSAQEWMRNHDNPVVRYKWE